MGSLSKRSDFNMTSFYERYQQGFYHEVYDELLELGENVFADATYEDAQLVAQSMMRRVRYNINLIISRLNILNYRFGAGMWDIGDEISLEEKLAIQNDLPTFKSPEPETITYIKELEQLIGTLPLSLIHWYKEVGCVNLVGLFPSKGKQEFYPQDGSQLDPLLIYSVKFVLKIILDYKRRNVWEKDPLLPLSPDNLFKYNYSGSGSYSMKIPCKSFDAPLLREKHHTTFINYLRICMRWGGFPGIEQGNKLSSEEVRFLTNDLVPF